MAARSQTALMTAEELLSIPDGFSRDELFEGTLLEMSPASGKHGRLSMRFGWLLLDHVDERNIGVVYDGSAGFIIERSPDSVLSPDVSFVKADRVPDDEEGYLDLAPDLAVEFISPSNRPGYVDAKIKKYLAAGTSLVLTIYPKQKHVRAHYPDGTTRLYQEGDIVEFGDVLPGFTLAVADIFN